MAVAETEKNISPHVVVLPSGGNKDKLLDYGLKAVLGLAILWGGRKLFRTLQKETEEKKSGSDPITQIAMTLHSAMNPSGILWLRRADGTDEDTIFRIAKDIRDWKKVLDSYKKLYSSSLTDDLQKELDAEDYRRLLNMIRLSNIVPTKGESNKSEVNFHKGSIIITKALANIRKTPKYSGTPSTDKIPFHGRSNVIATVDKGIAVGVAAGKSSFDGSTKDGVLFIEIQVPRKGSAVVNKMFSAWVAASQVESIPVEEFKRKKPTVLTLSQNQYDEASSPLGDTGAVRIISAKMTLVMNENFLPVKWAEKNLILGLPLGMELKDNKGNIYVKFLTIQSQVRWVNNKDVRITP